MKNSLLLASLISGSVLFSVGSSAHARPPSAQDDVYSPENSLALMPNAPRAEGHRVKNGLAVLDHSAPPVRYHVNRRGDVKLHHENEEPWPDLACVDGRKEHRHLKAQRVSGIGDFNDLRAGMLA
jgi:hypothetical protein